MTNIQLVIAVALAVLALALLVELSVLLASPTAPACGSRQIEWIIGGCRP